MKTKLILGGIFFIGIFTMAACSRQQSQEATLPKNNKADNPTSLTLTEFEKEPWNQSEQTFFKNTKITDNRTYFNKKSELNGNARTAESEFPIKVKFKWAGIGKKGGCTFPIGVCVIIPIGHPKKPKPNPNSTGTDMITTKASLFNNKLKIIFPKNVGSNFGLTKDGYLPILKNIPVTIKLKGKQIDKIVESGIYKANYDSSHNRYVGVVLNLK